MGHSHAWSEAAEPSAQLTGVWKTIKTWISAADSRPIAWKWSPEMSASSKSKACTRSSIVSHGVSISLFDLEYSHKNSQICVARLSGFLWSMISIRGIIWLSWILWNRVDLYRLQVFVIEIQMWPWWRQFVKRRFLIAQTQRWCSCCKNPPRCTEYVCVWYVVWATYQESGSRSDPWLDIHEKSISARFSDVKTIFQALKCFLTGIGLWCSVDTQSYTARSKSIPTASTDHWCNSKAKSCSESPIWLVLRLASSSTTTTSSSGLSSTGFENSIIKPTIHLSRRNALSIPPLLVLDLIQASWKDLNRPSERSRARQNFCSLQRIWKFRSRRWRAAVISALLSLKSRMCSWTVEAITRTWPTTEY